MPLNKFNNSFIFFFFFITVFVFSAVLHASEQAFPSKGVCIDDLSVINIQERKAEMTVYVWGLKKRELNSYLNTETTQSTLQIINHRSDGDLIKVTSIRDAEMMEAFKDNLMDLYSMKDKIEQQCKFIQRQRKQFNILNSSLSQ